MPSGTRRMGMTHLNGNILCAIDIEATGSIPGYHDLIQLAILPLDYKLDPWNEILPFYCELKPKRPETYGEERERQKNYYFQPKICSKEKFCHAQINGVDPYRAADLFEEWFTRLNLAFEKRISPLAHNWPHDRGFLLDWLSPKSFDYHFDARYRDTMVAASYENDKADFKNEPYPFPKVNLAYLSRVCNLETVHTHDALYDAMKTAAIYKACIKLT